MLTTDNADFNIYKHQLPKYDLFGRIKKITIPANQNNILANKSDIKNPWESNQFPEPMTRTKLFENRKKEKVPDISYDLDRDGFVGGRDYFLAKKFDYDNDGKLNEKERKDAYNAINNNYESKFVWGLEKEGSNRPCRILQKRGKIVDGEDFLPIRDTYPPHPLSAIKPHASSLTELKQIRKSENQADINMKMKKWDEKNPVIIVKEPPKKSESANIRKTKEQIKVENHRNARINCGLEPEMIDIKNTNNDPTLEYVYDPPNKTRHDIKEKLFKEKADQHNSLINKIHKDDIGRLNDREDEVFALLYSNQDRFTLTKLKNQRRKENLEYNLNKFSRKTIGVHGHELPKFAESEENKEFWKNQEGYIENPNFNSLIELKENRKYWKKPETLLLEEHREYIQPEGKKFDKIIKKSDDNIILKVNNLNHFKNFDPDNPTPIDPENYVKKHISRWTSLMIKFAPQRFKKGRLFDTIKETKSDAGHESYPKADFESDYMNNQYPLSRKKTNLIKSNDNEKIISDNILKDSLYLRFATFNKDKNIKPFNIRTKGF